MITNTSVLQLLWAERSTSQLGHKHVKPIVPSWEDLDVQFWVHKDLDFLEDLLLSDELLLPEFSPLLVSLFISAIDFL